MGEKMRLITKDGSGISPKKKSKKSNNSNEMMGVREIRRGK